MRKGSALSLCPLGSWGPSPRKGLPLASAQRSGLPEWSVFTPPERGPHRQLRPMLPPQGGKRESKKDKINSLLVLLPFAVRIWLDQATKMSVSNLREEKED